MSKSRIATRAVLAASTALAAALTLAAAPAAAQTAPTAKPATDAIDAQSTLPPEDRQDAAPQGDIVVTGSALPTSPDQVAVPVSVIGSGEIAKGGVSGNALELVRKQIPSFAGRSNTGNSNANNTNQNTAGGSQAQLRNLDTLVLIDGRRAAVNAIAGLGGKVFVDLAQVPVAAIDRVEVLTDGASAIYGSDAVGGVINFILKSDYEGLTVDGRYGFADGGYHERNANFLFGHNLTPGINITVAGSWSKTDPLYQNQRSFTSPFYSTSTAVPGSVVTGGLFGVLANGVGSPAQRNPTGLAATAPNFAALVANGTYINTPTTTSAQTSPATANSNIAVAGTGIGGTYDYSQYQTLLLGQEQKALDASLKAAIVDDLVTFYANAQLADNRSFTQFRPVTTGVTLAQGAPYNPVAGTLSGITFGSTAYPKRYYNHNESLRLTAGFKGNLGHGWRYDVAYVHSANTLFQRQENVIFGPNLTRAIAGGYDALGNAVAGGAYSKVYSGFSASSPLVLVPALDPLANAATVNRSTLGDVFGTEQLHATSKLDSVDGTISGELFDLPGGAIDVAVGGAYRREALTGTTDQAGYVHADPNYCNDGDRLTTNAAAWIGGQSADPFPVACTSGAAGSVGPNSRRISAVYGEVRVPITGANFELPGFHKFDLIGAVRHEHYSDAGSSTVPKVGFFWQPDTGGQITLRGTYSKSFTAPPLYQEYGPVNFRLAGPGIIPAAFPGLPAGLSPVEDGVNPTLQPAKATSWSLGIVLKPSFVPRLRVSVDYSVVHESGLPGGIGFSNIFLDVNQNGAASLFAGNIAKGNFPGLPGATPFANPGDLRAYLAADPNNYSNVYAIDRFTNLGGIRVRTLNGTIDYSLPTTSAGTFSFSSIMAVFLNYQFQSLPSQPFYEYAGTATNGGTGVQGTLPRFRAYTQVDWNRGPFDLTLGNTYISGVTDLGVGGITYYTNAAKSPPTAFAGRIKPYTTFDARLAYTVKDHDGHPSGFSIAIGVNDIFNRMPPVSTNVFTPSAAYTDNTADVSTYSPIGRTGYVQASVRF